MKDLNINVAITKLCSSVYLKLLLSLSWLSIIAAGGYYHYLLETYLVTILIAFGVYLGCNAYGSSQVKIHRGHSMNEGPLPPKENYLDVFMPSSQLTRKGRV